MRIIFLGTSEFSLSSLKKLYESNHELIGVITQPDKPSGRGHHIEFSPVKKFALEKHLRLFQYEKISQSGVADIKSLSPDIMVTASYGQIISQEIINIPKYGIINVHASLLPKYRGASPIQSAILNGETQTGVTIMQTEATLDTGDILATVSAPILPTETAGELSEKLASLGADLLLQTLDQIENNTATKIKQQHANSTITTKIRKEDCIVNFNKSAKQVRCLVMSANPAPIARAMLVGGTQVLIYRALETDLENTGKNPGEVVEPTSPKNGLFVQCGSGVLEILEAQLPGGKVLSGKQLVGGRKIVLGSKFMPLTFPMHHEEK